MAIYHKSGENYKKKMNGIIVFVKISKKRNAVVNAFKGSLVINYSKVLVQIESIL